MGISGYSGKFGVTCNECHSGGQAPTVSFGGSTSVNPGATTIYTFTLHSNNPALQTKAGLDIAASGGTLAVVTGEREQLVGPEVTHAALPTTLRSINANGDVTWQFKWTAPSTASNYVLYGAGNSVNGDGGNGGDRAAAAMLFIAVGDVTPLPTFTLTSAPTSTATRTPTPTATLPATPSATASPSPTATPPATSTPTATRTPTAVDTPSPTPSPTQTSPPSATATQTDTPPPTPTATETATPQPSSTPTQTATATDTASPTPLSTPGDANCDGGITAADLPARVVIPNGSGSGPCGADTNRNGATDDDDVVLMIGLMFGEP